MILRRAMTALIMVALSAVATASLAGPNLVTNGSFSTFTPSSNTGACSSNTTTQQVTNCDLSGWTTTSGYSFILNSSNATGGFTTTSGGALSLYGPVTASPDGGNFLAADGAYQTGTTSQTLVGLVTGATYAVSFYQAAGQQSGFSGTTTDLWTVSLGSSSKNSTLMNLASGTFSGWMAQTLTFVATATTEVLGFLAVGTPAGQPPFALLDGVSVTQVPEPPAYGLLAVGLFGLLGARQAFRKRG